METSSENGPGETPGSLSAWEQRAEVPLLVLAVAFLVAYAVPILDPTAPRSLESALRLVSWLVWVAFAVDFVVRVVLAEHRVRYVRSHWYDVALIGLPMLRPLRLLRLLTLAAFLNRTAAGRLVTRISVYAAGSALTLVLLGSLAVLDAERGTPGANITSFGDALWWSCTTVTTVGYGDYYPITTTGRCVAVVLMFAGVALVGSVTATFATWLIEKMREESERRH